MDHVMPPRFYTGSRDAYETLDEIAKDSSQGYIEAIAAVVVIDGEAFRYQSVGEYGELVHGAIEDLSADVEQEDR